MNKVQGEDSFLLSTVTLAQPEDIPILTIGRAGDNREVSELLPSQVPELRLWFVLTTTAFHCSFSEKITACCFERSTLTLTQP